MKVEEGQVFYATQENSCLLVVLRRGRGGNLIVVKDHPTNPISLYTAPRERSTLLQELSNRQTPWREARTHGQTFDEETIECREPRETELDTSLFAWVTTPQTTHFTD
ncbi:hypothetical protein BC826DRAFT_973773 [Russula brevipes]|nr:hypothetical protein BC826DRAFT_973773 [Russula brevipes]